MKHGQKPTREMKMALARNNLDSYDFMYIKAVGNGWQFRSKTDPETSITIYPDRKGIFMADGVTPIGDLDDKK